MTYTVQILVGNSERGRWGAVTVDACHATLAAAIERASHGTGMPSWIRIKDETGKVIPRNELRNRAA